MIESNLMDWSGVVKVMSINPAKIAGYENHGSDIKVGSSGNFAVIDTKATWRVDRNRLASKSKNTPFEGMELPATVLATVFNGKLVHGGQG
jgi:dihydroorotase